MGLLAVCLFSMVLQTEIIMRSNWVQSDWREAHQFPDVE